jgi:hypothetical protein
MEKKIAPNTFTNGVNSNTSDEFIPNNMYRYLLNMRQNGNDGVLKNVKGNTLVPVTLPSGENLCIGYCPDESNNRLFYFLYNSNGFHSIREYSYLTDKVRIIILSKIDSGGLDVLNFDKKHLVLNPFIKNDLLYWVDSGFNEARKVNVAKATDENVYAGSIYPDIISVYKKAPFFQPKLSYFTDNTRNQNLLYGKLFKAAYRNIYDDGEKSVFSDYSKVELPIGESYRGNLLISSNNNRLDILLSTGVSIVAKIEIAIEINNDWKTVKIIDKKAEGLTDNSTYIFKFYNDGDYSSVSIADISKPYDFLPDKPKSQELLKEGILSYFNFDEGFEKIKVDATIELDYIVPDFSGSTTIAANAPTFTNEDNGEYLWIKSRNDNFPSPYDSYSGNRKTYRGYNQPGLIEIGPDVDEGNKFTFYEIRSNLLAEVIATKTDTARTILENFKSFLYGNGHRVGIITAIAGGGFALPYTFFNRDNVLHPIAKVVVGNSKTAVIGTNKSIKVYKDGARYEYGIVYERLNGKKYPTIPLGAEFQNPFITELGTLKIPLHKIFIKHRPPIDAYYFQIVRTENLSYSSWFHILTQGISAAENNTKEKYLDLVIDSIDSYKTLYPKAVVYYEFADGDRLRFIKNTGTNTYYPFYETEILEQRQSTEEIVNANVQTLDGQAKITMDPGQNPEKNKGKFIEFLDLTSNPIRRRIESVETGTNNYNIDTKIIGDYKRNSYKIIDTRNILRIKKPEITVIEPQQYSLIEVFTPKKSGTATGIKNFYAFGEKYSVLNPGLENRAHQGKEQNQSDINPTTTPAIFFFSEGDAYMRNRELPDTNTEGNINTIVDVITDQGFSDFYDSKINDNGRVNPENPDMKIIHYGSRGRYSQRKIQDTKINGLSSFDSDSRIDYEDRYGDIQYVYFQDNRLFIFKEHKFCWAPVFQTFRSDTQGNTIFASNDKVLNDLVYFAYNGGVGKNTNIVIDGTRFYGASDNSGILWRLSGDGIEEISATYYIDSYIKPLLEKYLRLGGRVLTGNDKKNNEVVFHFENILNQVFNNTFSQAAFRINSNYQINPSTFEVVTAPTHGSLGGITAEGRVLYTPTTDYIGSDSFIYKVKDTNGNYLPTTKKCFNLLDFIAEDKTPTAFDVIDVTNADFDIYYYSNEIIVQGINVETGLTIDAGGVSVNGGNYITGGTTVFVGDKVKLRTLSANTSGTVKTINISIGTVSDIWNVTNKIVDLINLTLLLKNDYLDSYIDNTGFGSALFHFTDTTEKLFLIPSRINRDGIEHTYEIHDVVGKSIYYIAGYRYIKAMAGSGVWQANLYYNGLLIKTEYHNGGNTTTSDVQIQTVFILTTPIIPVNGDAFKIEWKLNPVTNYRVDLSITAENFVRAELRDKATGFLIGAPEPITVNFNYTTTPDGLLQSSSSTITFNNISKTNGTLTVAPGNTIATVTKISVSPTTAIGGGTIE